MKPTGNTGTGHLTLTVKTSSRQNGPPRGRLLSCGTQNKDEYVRWHKTVFKKHVASLSLWHRKAKRNV